MHLLTGHFGRPGATPFSLTGQPNACGGVRDTGSLSHALPGGRLVANAKHREEMEDLWKVPKGRISPKPGYHAVALFDAIAKGDVKCCLTMCTNPGQTLPNNDPYRKGMEKGFMVVADSFHPTETTKFADVVLPAAMWVEKEGVKGNAERRYHLYPKVVDPPGEARSDLDILVDFAERIGHGDLISAKTPRMYGTNGVMFRPTPNTTLKASPMNGCKKNAAFFGRARLKITLGPNGGTSQVRILWHMAQVASISMERKTGGQPSGWILTKNLLILIPMNFL